MHLRKLTVSVLLLLLATAPLPAQFTGGSLEAAKKKKEIDEQIVTILDRTIGEMGSIRLANNRAVVYALSADVYWRYDPKRSRELFRTGANELLTAQAEIEREKQENAAQGLPPMMMDQDPRFDFLNMAGARDAELALELMMATRSSAIADAMIRLAQSQAMAYAAGAGVGAGSGTGAGAGTPPVPPDPDRPRAQMEMQLEQMLTRRAAAGDPEKLIKAIKDSLAKGISTNVFSLLQELMQKDEEKAEDLAEDVISKISGTDLAKNAEDLNGAVGIASIMARPPMTVNPASKVKIFAFTAEQSREVGLKLANTFLQPGAPPFVNNTLPRAISTLEKLVPEKAIPLKQKDPQNKKAAASGPKPAQPQPPRPFDPNDTPEAIIAAAARITDARTRTSAYQAAANRISTITDETRARRAIDSIPEERVRSQAQERFDILRIGRLTAEGRLDEVRAAIGTMPNRRMQMQRLVGLAVQFHRKRTPKDIETAAGLMNEARALTSQIPEDEDELSDHMELIRGYAVIDPDTAFRMVEPFMDQFNEMVQASAVLSRYNKRDRTFKSGELVMRISGNPGGLIAFRFIPQIQALAVADVERMSMLADRFQRSDARLLMKLYILQGYQRSIPLPFAPPPRAL